MSDNMDEPRDSSSAIMCGHANEAPARPCECDIDCYCKVNGGCRPKTWKEAIVAASPAVSMIPVYGTMAEDDDGRHRGVMAYFSSSSAAESYGIHKGGWGGDCDVKEFSAIRLADGRVYVVSDGPIDLDLKKSKYEEELRKRTLASLTPEQIRVLGIKE